MGDIIAERLSRRDLVKGVLAVSAMTAAVSPLALLATEQASAQGVSTTPSFDFKEVAAGVDDKHYVADGYDAEILIRWGDPVLEGAPAFDPGNLTKDGQAKQFGYNNDYLGYFPLPGAANPSEHGLLCVNHEYTNEELMFPGLGRQDARRGSTTPFTRMTQAIAEVEMMAHGGSVLEVRKTGGRWGVVANSKYARRITGETQMRISGPLRATTG
jgi:secreted PhoX family phosphatase